MILNTSRTANALLPGPLKPTFMVESLEGAQYQIDNGPDKGFESDVDRAIFEVYGEGGLESFNDLYHKHPDWTLEKTLRYFEEHAVNPQTYFFRGDNLHVIAKQLCSKLESREASGPIEVLEIGCSSGKESYSLAVEMLKAGRTDFQITAVDVRQDHLEIAEKGEYEVSGTIPLLDHLSGLKKEHFEEGYFEDTGRTWQRSRYVGPMMTELKKRGYLERDRAGKVIKEIPREWYKVVEEPIVRPTKKVRERVDFKRHDMIDGLVEGSFDVILLNHVLSHYPEKTREAILRNALASLRSGGFLVLEHSMRPRGKEEAEWLDPYNEWRQRFAPKFGLEEVATKHGWTDEKWKSGQYWRYTP